MQLPKLKLSFAFKCVVFFGFFLLLAFSTNSAPLTKVKLQLFWQHQFEFAGFYAAIEQGYFKQYGLEVEFAKYNKNTDYINEVITNKAQFGIAGVGIIKAYHQGKNVKLLANYFKQSPLILLTQPEITQLSQLSGKTIYGLNKLLYRGSIKEMLSLHAIQPETIKTILKGDQVKLFKAKKISAILAFITDQPYQLSQENVPFRVFDPKQFGFSSQDLNLFTATEFADKNPDIVKKFTLAANRGWQYALEHPDEIIKLIKTKYNTQHKSVAALEYEAKETAKLILPDIYPIGSILKEKLIIVSQKLLNNKEVMHLRNIEHLLITPNKKQIKFSTQHKSLDAINKTTSISLTNTELQYISLHSNLTVQSENNFPPFNFTINNTPVGYSIDIINYIANQLNIKVKFIRNRSWSEYLSLLKSKKLDVMVNILDITSRRKYAIFTSSYADITNFAVFRKGSDIKLASIQNLKDKRIAITAGFAVNNRLKEVLPNNHFITVKNTLAAMKAISNGRADVYIEAGAVLNYYLNNNTFENLLLIPIATEFKIPTQPFRIAVHKDNKTLQRILQKSLSAIPEEVLIALRKKWFGNKKDKLLSLSLTKQEKQYLVQHPTIKVQNENNYPPFNYMANGKATGYSIDIIKIIAQTLSIDIEFVQHKSWQEYLELFKQKKLDALLNITNTIDRRQYALFTSAYAQVNNVAITRKNMTITTASAQTLAGKRIALARSYAINAPLKKLFPDSIFVPVKGTLAALKAISQNQVDVYIEGDEVVKYFIEKNFMPDLKLIPIDTALPLPNKLFSMASHKDNPLLQSILQKALLVIPEKKIKQLKQKWFGETKNKITPIIALTPEEQQYIASTPPLTLCNPNLAEEMDNTVNIVKLIIRNTGLTITTGELIPWSETISALTDKKCDLLPNIRATKQREKTLNFSSPYINSKMAIVSKKEQLIINELASNLDKTFVVIENDIVITLLKQQYPQIRLETVALPFDAFKLVQTDKVWGYIGSLTSLKNMLTAYSLTDLKINHLLSQQFTYLPSIATRKDDQILAQIMKKAVNNVDKTAITALYNHTPNTEITFTPAEQKLIKSRTITLCYSDYSEGWNELLQYLTKNIGMQLIKSNKYPWQQALQYLQNGKCDILPEASETPERRKTMSFTPPVYQEQRVIATSDQQTFITNITDHLDKTFVVQQGDILVKQLQAEYPQIKLTQVNFQINGLQRVQNHQAFAYIGTISNVGNTINEYNLTNIKIAGSLPDRFNDIWSIATRKDDVILHNILSKIVKYTDKRTIKNKLFGQFSIQYNQGFDYQLFWQIITVALTILLVFIFWNRRLATLNNKQLIATQLAENAQQQVKNLLNSSGEGFLSFKADLLIGSQYSKFCLQLFHQDDITDNNIVDLLFPDQCRDKETLLKGLTMIFNTTEVLKQEMLIALLPAQLNKDAKTLTFSYHFSADKCILIINDISKQEALKQQLIDEHQIQQKIIYALKYKNDINQIITEFSHFWQEVNDTCLIKIEQNKLKFLEYFYRRIHTFKGLFLQIHFINIAAQLHNIEELLATSLGQLPADHQFVNILIGFKIEKTLEDEKQQLQQHVGKHFFVEQREFTLNEEQLRILTLHGGNEQHLNALVEDILKVDIFEWLTGFNASIHEQALQLNKKIAPLKMTGDDIRIDEAYFHDFFHSLVHIFRNIIAHGIETEEQRITNDKPAHGYIGCEILNYENQIKIIISDDGSGVDIPLLREKINCANQLSCKTEELSEREVLMHLFKSGYTSANKVTMTSGRGIGLSEVLFQTEKLNGSVHVESTLGQGTSFHFTLPLPERTI